MIETERLLLRQFDVTDLNDYWEIVRDQELKEYKDCSLEFLRILAIKSLKASTTIEERFAIVLKDENKVIGLVELMHPHYDRFRKIKIANNSRELGFVMSLAYQRHGYTKEAAAALLKYGFEILGLNEIYACNEISNIGSSKVQEDCNFSVVGTHNSTEKGEIVESRITKDEYFHNEILKRRKDINC